MFKYVSYTPMTDAYTTHEFNEKDDKCKVHRFDVPYVSAECESEEDFLDLMAYQNPLIEAVEITKVEFEDLVKHSDQVSRMYDVANEQYRKDLEPVTKKYSQEEMNSWPVQSIEANAIISGEEADTPYLDALALDEDITVEEAAAKVLLNKSEYDNADAVAQTSKRKTLSELKMKVGM